MIKTNFEAVLRLYLQEYILEGLAIKYCVEKSVLINFYLKSYMLARYPTSFVVNKGKY